MKYKAGQRRRAAEYEPALVEWWKKNKTFEKSVESRPEDDSYVFYDGPPFITGMPHHGTLLSSIVKDAVPRYWTMRGKRVERRWGWDCHGLPAENFVEKQLGITDRREIGTKWSLEDYIVKARESMVANSETWEGTIDRIGRWVDFKGAYRTMDKNFMESVWWAFKTLYEAGKIYEGRKVLMYDTKFATPVSKSEVTMDNDAYQEVTDPSAYVKFKVKEFPDDVEYKFVNFEIDPNKRYASFDLKDYIRGLDFPETLGALHLKKDGEFHVSLLKNTEAIQRLSDDELKELQRVSLEIGKGMKTEPKLTGEFLRLVDDERGLETVVGLLAWDELKKWQDRVRKIVPEAVFAIPHVTLYVNDKNEAIGYTENKKNMTQSLSANDVEILREAMGRARQDKYLLAWTTTPWTLPANMVLAVNPEMEYAEVEVDGDKLYIAKSRIEAVLKDADYKVIYDDIKGADLVGLTYEPICGSGPLFDEKGVQPPKASSFAKSEVNSDFAKKEDTWTVLGADFVSDGDGTGIVHIAPAYGEDDYKLAQEHEVDFADVLDEYGYYTEPVLTWLHELGVRDTDERGIEIWAGNKFIAKCLEEKGIVWKIEYIKHEYPFNPRSKQRIMYRAFPSWFFDVQGQKELMIAQNENINWFPEYLKHGRFEKNIEQAPDWNLSRDRFWATAMPVWKGDKGTVKVVGSYAELKELSGVELEDYHRPWVDEIEFDVDGEHFKRIEKVLDCWFESGSMPFAQLHYPFENKEKFERNYPADFIVEYVGQVRAWFYYVHCVNSALASIGAFDSRPSSASEDAVLAHRMSDTARSASPSSLNLADSQNRFVGDERQLNAFKNVITTGTLAGNDGRKMSKSLGNYTDPNVLMDQYSADALRFLLLSSPVLSGEDFALTDKDVSDTQRKLAMIWNVYDFFTTYAEVDGWEFKEGTCCLNPQDVNNPLDKWIVSRLHQLRDEVTENMNAYNLPAALAPILPFVDDLSNWFVRRSRRRFWKSEDDGDKAEAYRTLHYVMVKLAMILAPFTPFLAEELWQNLVADGDANNSVHLKDWPERKEVDQEILKQMAEVRAVINEGLALRMQKSDTEEQVKVRQPLAKLVYTGEELPEWGIEIVKDEVNVKEVERGETAWIDKNISEELAREGFIRELIRSVQSARKKAGLNVDDRIKLSVSCEVPEEWKETLMAEVLALELTQGDNYAYDEIAKVSGENVTISLEKA